MEDDSDPTIAVAWEFIEQNYDRLRATIRASCRHRPDVEDEMFSDVVPFAVIAAVRTYDSTNKASLRSHVLYAVRLYSFKWWYRYRKWYNTHCTDELPEHVKSDNQDIVLEVQMILDRLDPYDRGLLTMYHLMGMTFEEMSVVLGVSKGTARNHYRVSMKRAREEFGLS